MFETTVGSLTATRLTATSPTSRSHTRRQQSPRSTSGKHELFVDAREDLASISSFDEDDMGELSGTSSSCDHPFKADDQTRLLLFRPYPALSPLTTRTSRTPPSSAVGVDPARPSRHPPLQVQVRQEKKSRSHSHTRPSSSLACSQVRSRTPARRSKMLETKFGARRTRCRPLAIRNCPLCPTVLLPPFRRRKPARRKS